MEEDGYYIRASVIFGKLDRVRVVSEQKVL